MSKVVGNHTNPELVGEVARQLNIPITALNGHPFTITEIVDGRMVTGWRVNWDVTPPAGVSEDGLEEGRWSDISMATFYDDPLIMTQQPAFLKSMNSPVTRAEFVDVIAHIHQFMLVQNNFNLATVRHEEALRLDAGREAFEATGGILKALQDLLTKWSAKDG